MKRTTTVAAAMLMLTTAFAHAENEAYDCFPGCAPAAAQAPGSLDLCRSGAVREAERINEKVKPAREIYQIAVNPTGFAVKMVDRHVVHIPKWVGIAMDPRGAARGYVIERVREAAKKQVGLAHDCKAPASDEAAPPAIGTQSIADIFAPRSL